MSGIKFFPLNKDVKKKKILLRLDLNVPIIDKVIQDDTRIVSILPFLNHLIKKKSKIILLSHLGRPKGAHKSEYSLLPIYKYLKNKINTNIYFFTGEINSETKDKIKYLQPGEIILFENIRFFEEENKNDENFAKIISELGEIYINDAFSCSHRKQASIHKIAEIMSESFAGPLMKQEIEAIDKIFKNKKKPVTCIIGGSKISTKINVLLNLVKNVDNLIIVGAMANNFLKYEGIEVGKSLIETNSGEIIKRIFSSIEKHKCKIFIPDDFKVDKQFNGKGTYKAKKNILKNEIILDIGKDSIEKIEMIIDQSKTVLWNGPAGYFENKHFAFGTNKISKKISENTINKSLISIIGGGDTISAINKSQNKLSFSYLSTAGGAFLEYLEGKDLPGLSVLK